jgi:cysteinyl-tRNA synthetase
MGRKQSIQMKVDPCKATIFSSVLSRTCSLKFSKFSIINFFKMSTVSTSSDSCTQPEWIVPRPERAANELKVYNSMTRSLVPFIPAEGKLVRWYSCGPTVYDAAHIGHARNYMTFDIIRRILRDYFNYDITYVMNITDIDDKIILRARQSHLLKEFAAENDKDSNDLRGKLKTAWNWFNKKKFEFDNGDWEIFEAVLMKELLDKKEAGTMSESEVKKLTALEASSTFKAFISSAVTSNTVDLDQGAFAEILAPWLDDCKGSNVTDQKIFRDLAAYWEADFMEDMGALNVLPADYLTRVSEYVPEIIAYVEKIIGNGFAYESEGSVYFDVSAFEKDPEHQYAKLCPWSAGNSKFFEEGEGSLGVKLTGKRDPRDFALWKCSKPGEPYWPSPWGNGRPGWHIECSAMASAVLPAQLDIHSGGIDLAFPHHDNEIAQAEAHFHSRQWVNYFLHAGHVHIEGLKMSKSLKNFISIKEALKRYNARQLRFLFLQHGWNSTLIYKESSMQAAMAIDSTFSNFFANVEAAIEEATKIMRTDGANDHGESEKKLLKVLDETRLVVDEALCDSFDTPKALSSILELISQTNVYMKSPVTSASTLKHVRGYVMKMYKIFGLSCEGQSSNSEASSLDVLAVLKEVSSFRDSIRALAVEEKVNKRNLFELCDVLRQALQPHGVVFEDRASGASLVKIVDAQQLAREIKAAEEKEAEAQARRVALLKLQEEKAKKAAMPPAELFKDAGKYSKWDERGVPTHDAAGEELSKNARKKCLKEFEAQEALYLKNKQ